MGCEASKRTGARWKDIEPTLAGHIWEIAEDLTRDKMKAPIVKQDIALNLG
jgi:hypothetical protein